MRGLAKGGRQPTRSPRDYKLLSYHSLAVNVLILSGDLVL
jgi:hypothetical protein